MRKHKIERISACNFRSFKELSFPVNDQGLVLILGNNQNTGGNNGAGKSSLAESLFYAIFDTTLRGDRSTETVNISIGKEMLVELDVVVDNTLFKVRNGRKFEGRNKVYEVVDTTSGEIIANPKDWWQKETGYGETVFSGLAVVSGSNPHPLVHGTDKDKKDYLTNLFSLHIFDQCYDISKNRLNQLLHDRDSTAILVQNKLREIESEKVRILSSKDFVQFENQLKLNKDLLDKLEEELHETLQKLGNIRSKYNKQAKQKTLVRNIENIKTEVNEIEEELGDRVHKLDRGEKKVEKISADLNSMTTEIRLLSNQISKIKELGDACPTCLQTISPQKKEELLLELSTRRDELEKRCTEHAVLLSKGKQVITRIRRYISQKEILESLEGQLTEVDLENDHEKTLKKLQEATNTLDDELKEVRAEIENITLILSKSEDARTRILEWEDLINTWNNQIQIFESDVSYWEFLQKAFGQYGIKSMKLDTVLDTLNYCIQDYIGFLTSSQISAEYRPVEKKTRDQFELFVTDSAGERSFKSWSGGEKKRVLVAALLGIWQTAHELCSTPPNFVFLDDCFGDLDDVGQERVSSLMRSIALEGRSVFITSPVLQPNVKFDQVWYCEKVGDFSTLKI